MSKVPTRLYCSICKRGKHGKHCKKRDCTCKCQQMSDEQITTYYKQYHDEKEIKYSPEEEENFQNLMTRWRTERDSKPSNIEVKSS